MNPTINHLITIHSLPDWFTILAHEKKNNQKTLDASDTEYIHACIKRRDEEINERIERKNE